MLLLVADGATSAQIAHGLGIDRETVEQHIASSRDKAGARNRIELAALAVKEGIVGSDAAMRPVVWEVEWEGDGTVASVIPRYLGRAAVRRFPGFGRIIDRPFSDWMSDWKELLGPALDVLPLLEPGGSPVTVDGVKIIIPESDIEFEWSASIEAAGRDHFLLRITTPLP